MHINNDENCMLLNLEWWKKCKELFHSIMTMVVNLYHYH